MRNVVLFGGGGYIGRHLADEITARGHNPVVVDTTEGRYVTVDSPMNLVAAVDQVYQRLGSYAVTTDFIHLACRRNKPDTWDLEASCQALQDGFTLAEKLPAGRRLFVSSMSVYDDPPNAYAYFKRTAEEAARVCQFGIIRLATVLGGKVCYREDLGLHRIAAQLAAGKSAWVNSGAKRHVMSMDDAVSRILLYQRGPLNCFGLAAYKDIVAGMGVDVSVAKDGNAYGTVEVPDAPEYYVARLKCRFADLVNDIREGKVCPI